MDKSEKKIVGWAQYLTTRCAIWVGVSVAVSTVLLQIRQPNCSSP
jgi:hypothetical protein